LFGGGGEYFSLSSEGGKLRGQKELFFLAKTRTDHCSKHSTLCEAEASRKMGKPCSRVLPRVIGKNRWGKEDRPLTCFGDQGGGYVGGDLGIRAHEMSP